MDLRPGRDEVQVVRTLRLPAGQWQHLQLADGVPELLRARILDPCEVVRCKKYTLYQSRCFLLEDAECRDRVMRNYSYILDIEMRRIIAENDVLLKCQPPVARCINTAPEVGHPSFESSPTYIHAASLPAHCELPQDRGFCSDKSRVRLARVYFYSKRQNQCKFMVNFGCSRNQNYFNSLADCYNSCGL
ncbi:hypothetical protein BOX15_Mlig023298g1 [Macrostomum lignano]|uniref:BPTI/Kunitz inhibitor domain-containing protein n=1 Tax=Macrostomum lignano TaxID=282301 RepID=A0A267GIR7_9PLAT|nr:hypothetical protein BOX15_Mlig023298g1 [Macrostomum lignano]